jgi:Spy/CpxP family protein refolding chaperone
MRSFCILVLLTAGALRAEAQTTTTPPDTGQEDRPIKALSDADILSYLNGEAGDTRVAELNRYPGPSHVLELATPLGLTEPQRARVRSIYDAMHEKAAAFGKAIVSREAILDSLFSTRTIDSTHLRSLVSEIARLQGELRDTHLEAHLAVTRILAPDQIMAYDRLRGSAGESHDEHAGMKH